MEFNSINFNINNIANQKAGLVQNQNQPQQQAQPQLQQPQIQQERQVINPSLMFDFQAAKMDNETVLKYLQNLMKLPNTIDKFINQLNSKNIDPKLSSILIENMISIKALNQFLNQNSNDAISKLMQTISLTLKTGTNDVSQLKEILSILSTIHSSSLTNTNTLKELLLLYIPLNTPVFEKSMESKIQNEEEKQAIKNAKLSILFETINYSNLLAAINEIDNSLLIDIFAPKNFPKDDFIKIIEALSKETNVIPIIEFKEKQKVDSCDNVQNFKIISDGFISPNSLIIAHLIIKVIFKLDEI